MRLLQQDCALPETQDSVQDPSVLQHPLPLPHSIVPPTPGQSSPPLVGTPWGQQWDGSRLTEDVS